MSTWGQRHLCAAHSVAFTNKVVGIQAKPAVSKSEAKITMPQVCSFLFFFFQKGKAQAFFSFPARGNLSQTFHKDSPWGRHQTWIFSTREQQNLDF